MVDTPYFKDNYAFKGGTCLTKCYLGYYRFSEDLDFTFLNQDRFAHKSEKQIRKIISVELDQVITILERFCKRLGLDFVNDKSNQRYFEFGAGNKFMTIKLYYNSVELNKESFLKLQISFIESLLFPIKEKKANNLISNNDTSIKFLIPSGTEWVLKIPLVNCYDIKEILSEKIMAILTRRGVKSRDFIDVYLIIKAQNLNIFDFKEKIIKKIKPMLIYAKYNENFRNKLKQTLTYKKGDEERLLIKQMDSGFLNFINTFDKFLKELMSELK